MLERQNEGENISEASSIAAAGSGVVEETDPDLLKNTPSNIRRLADEIQQFEGRQKYLAQTRSSSDGGDVRWYFCKVPLGFNRQYLPPFIFFCFLIFGFVEEGKELFGCFLLFVCFFGLIIWHCYILVCILNFQYG